MPILLGYIRRSVLDADDPTSSPARQRAAIERAAAGLGCTVEWFEDLDISGRYERNRPGWQALLGRLDDPQVIGVAVESFDRSHRNVLEFLAFADKLAAMGKRLISANQNVDLNSADGRLMGGIMAVFAEAESRRASERTKSTIWFLQQNKGRHWGTQPFGTDRDESTKHLIPSARFYWLDPQTGDAWRGDDLPVPAYAEQRFYYDALRAMFDIYSTGRFSFQNLTEALTEAGWRFWSRDLSTPAEFNRQTVRSILQRWNLYAGELGAASAPPQRRSAQRRPGGHQPILPVELCRQVGEVYARRSIDRPQNHSNQSEHMYWLTGRLFCASCGQKMCGQACAGRRKEKYYYRHTYSRGLCREKIIPASNLEGAVVAALIEIINQEAPLKDLLATLRKNLEIAQIEDKNNGARLLDRRAELERLIDLYTSGLITKEQFTGRRQNLTDEIETLEKEYDFAELPMRADEMFNELLPRLARLGEAPPDLLRIIAAGIFDKIEAADRRIVRVELAGWVKPLVELCDLSNQGLSSECPTLILISWLQPA